MKNLKTTLAGWVLGLIPLVDALIKSYEAGYFDGATTIQTGIGIATIILGVWANDRKKID